MPVTTTLFIIVISRQKYLIFSSRRQIHIPPVPIHIPPLQQENLARTSAHENNSPSPWLFRLFRLPGQRHSPTSRRPRLRRFCQSPGQPDAECLSTARHRPLPATACRLPYTLPPARLYIQNQLFRLPRQCLV